MKQKQPTLAAFETQNLFFVLVEYFLKGIIIFELRIDSVGCEELLCLKALTPAV